MRQFLSLFVLLAFLLNNLSPAFAASCNRDEMLKNGSYSGWSNPACVLELACYCLGTHDKCAESFGSARDGSRLLATKCQEDRSLLEECIKAQSALSVVWNGVYTIGGTTRYSWDKDGNLQSRPYTQADWENDLKRGYAACGKEYSPKKLSDDSLEDKITGKVEMLKELEVIATPPNSSYPEPRKTTTETNKLDEVWSAYIEDLFKDYKEGEVKYKDLSGLIQTWVNRTKDTHPGDTNYISINNLRLLFSKYAGIAKNKKDLLKYVSSQYPARVQYAAAGACAQFSKYQYTKDNKRNPKPNQGGKFDFDQNERKALAEVLTEEFVRASQEPDANLSDIKYIYHQKMKRLYTYDPQNVKEYVAVPTTKGSILLSSAALGSLQSVGGNTFTVVLENGPFQFNVAPKVAETLNNLKNLATTKGMALSRAIPAGSSVAAIGMPIALPFVGAGLILWDINRGMQPIYEKRQVDRLSKELNNDINAVSQPADITVSYDPTIPANVMKLVRWTEAITLSRADNKTWTISLDKNAKKRVTCKENSSMPTIEPNCWVVQNSKKFPKSSCVKAKYQSPLDHINNRDTQWHWDNQHPDNNTMRRILQHEDKLVSSENPSKQLPWSIVYDERGGGWISSAEIPIRPLDARDAIQITTQYTLDQVVDILGRIESKEQILQWQDGTALRIQEDERSNKHIHFEEIQHYSNGDAYVCNHSVYFNKNMNIFDALLALFY